MKKLTLIVLLIFACSIQVFTQTKKFRVNIQIHSEEKQISEEVRSYLARELRSLGDVEVIDKGDITVKLHIFKLIGKDGLTAYAVSTQFLENVVCQGKAYANDIGSALTAVNPNDLRKLSEHLVTSLDTHILEVKRKAK